MQHHIYRNTWAQNPTETIPPPWREIRKYFISFHILDILTHRFSKADGDFPGASNCFREGLVNGSVEIWHWLSKGDHIESSDIQACSSLGFFFYCFPTFPEPETNKCQRADIFYVCGVVWSYVKHNTPCLNCWVSMGSQCIIMNP